MIKSLFKIIKCKNCQENIKENVEQDARKFTPTAQLVQPGRFFYVVLKSLSYLFYLIPRICNFKNFLMILQNILEDKIDFKSFSCKIHDKTSKQISSIIIRYSIYWWCNKVNRISKGGDSKFYRYLKNQSNLSLIDPIKLIVNIKYVDNVIVKKRNTV